MKMTKRHCEGCRDDFYNGKNPYEVAECWLFVKARLIKRVRVHINERPPWTGTPTLMPDCYHQEQYVFVPPEHPNCKKNGE